MENWFAISLNKIKDMEKIFRAKLKGTKEWIEGDLFTIDWSKVIKKTICQYINLHDKNGKKIFEGDIVTKIEIDYSNDAIIQWEDNDPRWDNLPKITRIDVVDISIFRFWLKNEMFGWEGEELQDSSEYEVIGNIFDNPEFIKHKKRK